MKIRKICVLDSMYTLLQYLLLSSEDDFHDTYFFFRQGISESVVRKLKNKCTRILKFKYGLFRDLFFYFIVIPLKYPFLFFRKLEYWGVDNLGYEKFIIRKNKFHLLEDGLLSYGEIPYKWKQVRLVWLKQFFMGPLAGPRTFVGEEKNCICRHLTGLKDSEILKDSKTKIDSLESLWEKSSVAKRNFVNSLYDVSENDLLKLKEYDRILFTQPLSEDGYISESDKIVLYKKIMEYAEKKEKFVIKPHPREKTDYSRYFKNALVLKTKAPFELLSLNGLRFSEVYTIFSTCAFDIPYEVNVYFFGSQVHPILGEIFKSNQYGKVGVYSANIHLMNIDFEKYAKVEV